MWTSKLISGANTYLRRLSPLLAPTSSVPTTISYHNWNAHFSILSDKAMTKLIWSKKDRSFSCFWAILFLYSHSRHIVYAPSKNNQYAAAGFPSIGDAIVNGNAAEIDEQVAITAFFVRGAASILKEFDNFYSQWDSSFIIQFWVKSMRDPRTKIRADKCVISVFFWQFNNTQFYL